jgi:hypothetical protein
MRGWDPAAGGIPANRDHAQVTVRAQPLLITFAHEAVWVTVQSRG